MKSIQRIGRTGLAAGLSGLLVAGTLALSGTASAAATGPASVDPSTVAGVLTWKVSEQVVARYGTTVATDGAFAVDGAPATVSFPVKSATRAGDQLEVAYRGTFASQFVNAGSVLYATTITDPVVTFDADGSGELSAVVSGMQNFPPRFAPESSTPTRVVVGEFDSTTGALDSSLAATITGFSPAFVNQMASGTRAHFDGTTEAKKPLPFTLEAPSATAEVVTVGGVRQVELTGKNFFGGDENYDGIYVGLAPSGGQPDTATQAGQKLYSGETWVVAESIKDGNVLALFDVLEEKLVAGRSYSVYTWQAHRHTSPALDTETVLGVLKAAAPVKKASKTTLKVTKKATTKKVGSVKVAIAGGTTKATGKATVKIKAPGKKVVTKKVTLRKGAATVALTKAKKKGTYSVTVSYKGDKNLKAAKTKVVKFKVKK